MAQKPKPPRPPKPPAPPPGEPLPARLTETRYPMLSPSKPLPADEKILIEMWHGSGSTAAIAAELGVKGAELDLAFRALKREGKLPKCSRQQVHQRAETVDSSTRPAADEDASAQLLELLIQHHGNDHPSGERADLYPGYRRR